MYVDHASVKWFKKKKLSVSPSLDIPKRHLDLPPQRNTCPSFSSKPTVLSVLRVHPPSPSLKSICSCLLLLASGSLQRHPMSPLLRSLCFSSVRVSAVLSALLTPYPASASCWYISLQHASLLPLDILLLLQDRASTVLISSKNVLGPLKE